ncbi:helix-turn-helix domain-containing protein [Rubinisphaera margarita]|uniref:helix-turn-helix domain-containing protein n=1 Tax=Rubinisphaera margarita TaxID=2909586 RepID=UPI0036F21A43
MFYTIREVASQLKISLSMAYALVGRGDLACYEIGSCKRVKHSDLEEFLERHRKEMNRLPSGTKKHF